MTAHSTATDLDPVIEALCADAALWLAQVTICADGLGVSVAQGIALMLAAQRPYTGYMPEAQRRNLRHRMYSDGLCTPPRRPNATDRALAEARAWGLA